MKKKEMGLFTITCILLITVIISEIEQGKRIGEALANKLYYRKRKGVL